MDSFYVQRIGAAIAYGHGSGYGFRFWLWLRDAWHLCRYFDESFFPVKCPVCGSTHFRDFVKDELEGVTIEYDVICNKCDSTLVSWIHGHVEFGSWLMPYMVEMIKEDIQLEDYQLDAEEK